jgi:transposase
MTAVISGREYSFPDQAGGQEEPLKKYIVALDPKERAELEARTRSGKASARQVKRALILLFAADGETDKAIAAKVRVHAHTVQRIRQRFVEESLDAALSERPRPGKARKLAGPEEAFVIALACTDAPEGRQTWTMQLLADRVVELKLVESISDDTIRRTLKRGTSSLGNAKSGASPR